jgi:hypothetical protein
MGFVGEPHAITPFDLSTRRVDVEEFEAGQASAACNAHHLSRKAVVKLVLDILREVHGMFDGSEIEWYVVEMEETSYFE